MSNGSVQARGEWVSVQGKNMFLRVAGAGPWTVVLESGWGRWSPIWKAVQSQLAEHHVTVAVDRLGLGQSEPGPLPRSAFQTVDELQEALQSLGLPGPYLAVGEGFGAVHMRVWAFREPAVKGMVLVDPVTEAWARSKAFAMSRDLLDRKLKRWTRRAGLRVARAAAWLTRYPVPGLDKDAAQEMRLGLEAENFFSMRAEVGAMEDSLQQLGMVGAPQIPTTVLSPKHRVFLGLPGWEDPDPVGTMQKKLSLQAPEGTHQVVEAQDRCIPVDAAESVVAAVETLASRLTVPAHPAREA